MLTQLNCLTIEEEEPPWNETFAYSELTDSVLLVCFFSFTEDENVNF